MTSPEEGSLLRPEESSDDEQPRNRLKVEDEGEVASEMTAKKRSDSSSKQAERLHMLHFRQLQAGAKCVGIVREVTKRDLVVSLPSLLTAFATPENLAAYQPGQWVLCVVRDVSSNGRHRRIIVDVDAVRTFNNGSDILPTELLPGLPLLGRATAKEPTGYVVDLQLDKLTMGFFKTQDPSTPQVLNRLLPWTVKAVSSRVVLVEPFRARKAVKFPKGGVSDRSLMAGSLVKRLPSDLSDQALFDFPSPKDSHEEKRMRLVYVDVTTDVYLFSRLPHILCDDDGPAKTNGVDQLFKIGSLVESVRYVASYGKSGCLFELIKGQPVYGFAHSSKLGRDKMRLQGSYACRVIGYDAWARCYQVSLTEDDLSSRTVYDYGDITSGLFLKATVVNRNPAGLVVALDKFPGLKAFVPTIECQGKALAEGDGVRGLVLDVDAARKRITFTLCAELINKRAQVPFGYEKLHEGSVVTGRIVAVKDYGAVLKFGQAVRGVLLKGDLTGERFVKDAQDVSAYAPLQAILTCRVKSVDADAQRLHLTLRADHEHGKESVIKATRKEKAKAIIQDCEVIDSESHPNLETQSLGDASKENAGIQGPSKKNDDSVQRESIPPPAPQAKATKRPILEDFVVEEDHAPSDDAKSRPTKQQRTNEGEGDLRDMRADFERRVLTAPNDSRTWIEYAGALMRLGDLGQARQVCERALASISYRHDAEKRNVWIAYLNLEWSFAPNAQGSSGSNNSDDHDDDGHHGGRRTGKKASTLRSLLGQRLADVFQRACAQADDAVEVTLAMARILAASNSLLAEGFYAEHVCRKHKHLSRVWLAYLHFLFSCSHNDDDDDGDAHNRDDRSHGAHSKDAVGEVGGRERARALLPHILQCLEKREHVELTQQVALLEYERGEPGRGRLLFEGLVSSYPRRLDVWLVYAAQETKLLVSLADDPSMVEAIKSQVRSIFERLLSQMALSTKKARAVFKQYLDFEKQFGTAELVEHVKDLARAYVEAKTGSLSSPST